MANGKCSKCRTVLTLENSCPSYVKNGSGYCRHCRCNSGIRDEEQRKGRQKAAILKEQVFEKLGFVCVKCGFSDRRALQIDHKNGGGRQDRHRHSQTGYFKFILGNLELYQILCANCNWIKMYENGEISIHREKDSRGPNAYRKHTGEKLKDSSDGTE